jgi:hypothetical protein
MCQIIGLFFVVNDSAKINSINPQIMRCILGHLTPVNVDSNGNKVLVSYNTQYGTSVLKKHVTNKHVEEYRRWGLFVMQKSKDGGDERQAAKKQKTIPPFQITNFFGNHQRYNKSDPTEQTFLEDLVLYIAKGYRPLSSVENPWLKH